VLSGNPPVVIAALDPAIHRMNGFMLSMDARVKPAHKDLRL
jgi:hypothetical protein